MKDIDELSRKVPCLCKLAPNTQKYSVQECGRAGGILGILNELNNAVDDYIERKSVLNREKSEESTS